MPVASQARIEANRANARKSTGPKTEAGKLASSRNALQHGFLSRAIPADDPEFHAMHADLRHALRPFDRMQDLLVEQIALAYLRLHRLLAADAREWTQPLDPDAPAPATDAHAAQLRLRYETMLNHQIQRSLALFESVRERAHWRLKAPEYNALMVALGYVESRQPPAEQPADKEQNESDDESQNESRPLDSPGPESSDRLTQTIARCRAARLAEERAWGLRSRPSEAPT